jgi:hypothetical protein
MLALDLDHAIAHRAARAAEALQFLCESGQLIIVARQPANDRHDFPAAAAFLAREPHPAIAGGSGGITSRLAPARRERLAAALALRYRTTIGAPHHTSLVLTTCHRAYPSSLLDVISCRPTDATGA